MHRRGGKTGEMLRFSEHTQEMTNFDKIKSSPGLWKKLWNV